MENEKKPSAQPDIWTVVFNGLDEAIKLISSIFFLLPEAKLSFRLMMKICKQATEMVIVVMVTTMEIIKEFTLMMTSK